MHDSTVKKPSGNQKTVECIPAEEGWNTFQSKNSRATTVEYIAAEKHWNPTTEQAL